MARASCNVLWKTDQRTPVENDGPIETAVFDPDGSESSFDVDYPGQMISVFGEWGRLPLGSVNLAIRKLLLSTGLDGGVGQTL